MSASTPITGKRQQQQQQQPQKSRMHLQHPPSIASVTVHRKSKVRRLWLDVFSMALYALIIPWVWTTMGEPRRVALAERDRTEAALLEKLVLASQTEKPGVHVNGTGGETEGEVPPVAVETLETQTEEEVKETDKETNRTALIEAAKAKYEALPEFDPMFDDIDDYEGMAKKPIPSALLPNAWAGLTLFLLVSFHILFHLMTRWNVWFRAEVFSEPAFELREGSRLLIQPKEHRGATELIELKEKSERTGNLVFWFQRQKFEVLNTDQLKKLKAEEAEHKARRGGENHTGSESAAGAGGSAGSPSKGVSSDGFAQPHSEDHDDDDETKLVGEGEENGAIRPVQFPISNPVSSYTRSKGLADSEAADHLEYFGPNVLSIKQPRFLNLVIEQLLSPISVFQIFTSALWLLDAYWRYTVITLFSVVGLECATVFQRLSTLRTLRGMCAKAFVVWVYRRPRGWVPVSTEKLCAGDLISLQPQPPSHSSAVAAMSETGGGGGAGGGAAGAGGGAEGGGGAAGSGGKKASDWGTPDVVPCDCVILRGAAVVNEATLTGESVPLMKDALRDAEGDSGGGGTERLLDMEGTDRVHVLFSGTTMMSVSAGGSGDAHEAGASGGSSPSGALSLSAAGASPHIPPAPDGGCLAYVLRTGFSSSQGSLVQMIEFSQQEVGSDTTDTVLALLVLLLFALAASAYVLVEGLKRGDRTTHELLLKCIIILTSVVPRQLPLQMAFAVNQALLALTKGGIYCTEPYRVPAAGRITHVLFDKTGTLTSDLMVPIGVVNPSDLRGKKLGVAEMAAFPSHRVTDASCNAALVLATCHSLFAIDSAGATGAAPPPAGGAAGGGVVALANSSGNRDDKDAQQARKAALIGDPIELAALKGVGWGFDAATSTSRPGDTFALERAAARAEKELWNLDNPPMGAAGGNPNPQVRAAVVSQLEGLRKNLADARERARRSPFAKARILSRQHFASSLQRMSVVAEVDVKDHGALQTEGGGGGGGRSPSGSPFVCLVKGSAEALQNFMDPASLPENFTKVHTSMAERGMRVLALAYRWVSKEEVQKDGHPSEWSRGRVERGVHFAGFIAFTCRVRGDSDTVVKALRESGHKCMMVTGDAPLTALHVARQVTICSKETPALLLTHSVTSCAAAGSAGGSGVECEKGSSGSGPQSSSSSSLLWTPVTSGRFADGKDPALASFPKPFDVAELPRLAEQGFELCVTEQGLEAASEVTKGAVWRHIGAISVFARMKPPGKARIIRALQMGDAGRRGDGGKEEEGEGGKETVSVQWLAARCREWTVAVSGPAGNARRGQGSRGKGDSWSRAYVMMCGDGGNDVGALKQGDVGLALLSGYGDTNTKADLEEEDSQAAGALATTDSSRPQTTEARLNMQNQILRLKQQEASQKISTLLKNKQQELQQKMASGEWLAEEMASRRDRGLPTEGMVAHAGALTAVAMRMRKELMAERSRLTSIYGNVYDDESKSKAGGVNIAAQLEEAGGVQMIRPGDASVAAPFTTRIPSVRSCVDLLRQGRCTLLGALQQQQIMMLECMISAYTMSALSLEGGRSSERQMLCTQWLVMIASLAFSYSSPVERMHPERPPHSLFSPAIFVSTLGQAAIHLITMVSAVRMATDAMGPALLAEVKEFNRKVKMGTLTNETAPGEETDYMAMMLNLWQQPFMPNLMNSAVFLVETAQMFAVLFVNYKGRPWMSGTLENRPLFISCAASVAGVCLCAWEVFPWLNELLHLKPFPTDEFRFKILGLVLASLFGTLIWDRICIRIFSPRVFNAMWDELVSTRPKDFVPIFNLIASALGVLAVLASNNPIVMIGAFMIYRNWRKAQNDAEAARLLGRAPPGSAPAVGAGGGAAGGAAGPPAQR
uniref:Uncharacterized protein n=1 Tax=Chromera velia CCMP2878 TaxID=1169474 RepID=A0A0G4HKL1_9ALVE|eukprot:Cvel_28473.t1-p1 / transcript=Cvel_28473.t1 / gene=Cvel_28473 / organism=Chromera_velia_CCMP2878 / gene_product=Probable cation-transporting ATPase 13A1, putative / transcript_product=Probable cation-transporting ATPase 13A1, putative / location=Cvel_scaffold3735:4300-12179(+) / protein_length=1867 / sequence_SO=supercontig / SO=protein_coding / is_pseudo=false